MNSGIFIGIIFSVSLGVLGGAIGTYFSVKNTSGPRERAFMIRVSIFTWIAVSIFVAALHAPCQNRITGCSGFRRDRVAADDYPLEQEADGDSE